MIADHFKKTLSYLSIFNKTIGFCLTLFLASCVNYLGIGSNKKIASFAFFKTSQSIPQQHGTWPTTSWAKQFGDPQLPALIHEGLANNPDLQAAKARIKQAQALADNRAAALYPYVDWRGSINRVRLSSHNLLPPGPLANSNLTQYAFLFKLTYTLDIWGKNSSYLKQAISNERASEATDQETRLSLATSIASTYNQLAFYYALRDILRKTVIQREALHKISSIRLKTGLDTKTQLFLSRNTTETARTQLFATEGQIALTRQQLALLLGVGPDRAFSIKKPRLKQIKTPTLPARLPLNLLGRRPDIVRARWQVEASCQGIHYTQAKFYPNINITAGLGDLALVLSHFTARGNVEYLGPAFSLPIFDAGALRAELRRQYAIYEEAVANYNSILNTAFSEIATLLTNIHSIERQLISQTQALNAAIRAYNLASIQYKTGLASQLVVLDAETRLLNEQQNHLQLLMNRRNLDISLIKALGGGVLINAVEARVNAVIFHINEVMHERNGARKARK